MGKSGVGTASAFATVVAGANSHILTLTSAFTAENSANSGGVVFQSAGNTSYAISGFSVVRLGLTLAPDAAQPGGSNLWYDTSGNARTTTLPASGVKWDTPTGGYNPQESSVNGSLGFLARNNSQGNAAVAAIDLQNEFGASYGFGMRYFGNSFAQVNAYRANRGLLYGAFDLNFLSGQYKFWFGTTGAAIDNSTAYEGFNLYGPSISTGTATVYFTTPSSAFGTGALIVGGGASFGGALFSQQNSNAIVTGTNFANTNTGTAATLRHTLTAGTNTSTIEAYSNGHATFPGRLRFGTPNGQMDFVPSGVLGLSISASAVTTPVGLINISKSGAGSTLEINADSGFTSKLSFQRATTNRWTVECDSSDNLTYYYLGTTRQLNLASSSSNVSLSLGPTGAAYIHTIRSATAGGAIQIKGDPSTGDRYLSLGHIDNASAYTEGLRIDSNAIVRATGTTASTGVTSGALVIGNGTSGGLGVSGAIFAGGTLTATGGIIDPPIIGTILEDIFTITDGAAFEVDPGNGSIQLITLGASRTPKATNFAAGESITLMVNDGTAYTLTWTDATWGTGGVVWVGGTAPTLATSGYTVIQFWKVGTQIYGARVGDVA
jgi:hypothetical protein